MKAFPVVFPPRLRRKAKVAFSERAEKSVLIAESFKETNTKKGFYHSVMEDKAEKEENSDEIDSEVRSQL